MKDEYDFSNAERGKFHRSDAQLIPPVRLSSEERAGIERGLEDMRAERFATDEEIAAIFRRARSF
jgi:predicted transcriptional regulator